MNDKIKSLEYFISKHISNKRWIHDDGECAGINCPYCEYEKQSYNKNIQSTKTLEDSYE